MSVHVNTHVYPAPTWDWAVSTLIQLSRVDHGERVGEIHEERGS